MCIIIMYLIYHVPRRHMIYRLYHLLSLRRAWVNHGLNVWGIGLSAYRFKGEKTVTHAPRTLQREVVTQDLELSFESRGVV